MDRSPRVLFVDHTAVLGGAELYLLDACDAFKDRCAVVLFSEGPLVAHLRERGIPVRVLPAGSAVLTVDKRGSARRALGAIPGTLSLAWRLSRLAHDYDVLFANSQKALVVTALAGRLARRPVIWSLHDLLTADHFGAFNRRLVVALANRWVTRVLVNSEATRAALDRAGGDVDDVHVVYNGLDARPFDAVTDEQVTRMRARLGLTGEPVVGVFSRLAPWKGQHVLLEALTHVPTLHALLVGAALFEHDRPYQAQLEGQIERLGLGRRVHLLGFREDVPLLMRMVDIVAHTSIAPEPFGRVIVEGMLARKPVLATHAGGAVEIITTGHGRLVPPGDPEAMAHALKQVLTHREEAAGMGEAGYARATRLFTVEGMHAALRRHVAEVERGVTRPSPPSNRAQDARRPETDFEPRSVPIKEVSV